MTVGREGMSQSMSGRRNRGRKGFSPPSPNYLWGNLRLKKNHERLSLQKEKKKASWYGSKGRGGEREKRGWRPSDAKGKCLSSSREEKDLGNEQVNLHLKKKSVGTPHIAGGGGGNCFVCTRNGKPA